MTQTDRAVSLDGCEIIARYDQITDDDWRELRHTGLGGSDAGTALGMNKYTSPLSLCMEKTGRMEPADIGDIEAVKIGNLLEPLIRQHIVAPYIQEVMGQYPEVIEPDATYRSKAYPWMLANVDGFIRLPGGELVGLEIKTGSSYALREWGGINADNEIPDSYYCQVQHYMAVTGLPKFFVFGLIGNRRLLRIVPADSSFIANLIQREKELWETIRHNDPMLFPAPSGIESDERALEVLGTPRDEGTADVSEITEVIADYVAKGKAEKKIAEERKTAKQMILAALGTHKCGCGSTRRN